MPEDSMWLLLHGTPLTPEVWDGLRPTLGSIHPVSAPLLPRPATATGAQAEIADRVLKEVDHLAQRFHVVGHSFGGQVAVELALAAPRRVASLTVLCSRASPFPSFSTAAEALRLGEPVDVEASLARWFLPGELATNGPVVHFARRCLEQADRSSWSDDLEAIAVYDRQEDLASILVPTSIIASEFDKVGTPQEMIAMASAIPDVRFECVKNASHMSQFTDPSALADRIVSALTA